MATICSPSSTQTTTLVVLLGPTAVGKTQVALRLAQLLRSPIIGADSRQMFRQMHIGTAKPSAEQMALVEHHFVDTLDVGDYYSAAQYEHDTLQLIARLAPTHTHLLMVGGSMLYIDAVCSGIDNIPTIPTYIRQALQQEYQAHGLAPLLCELQERDPKHYAQVDRQNPKRVIHALEVCRTSGRPYSSLCTHMPKPRPFDILKIGLQRPRSELFARIGARVDEMMQAGLLDEARRLLPHRHHNALNTVGYKELFEVLDGQWDLPMAIERIKKNTRVYAKKQLTWFAHDPAIHWHHPDDWQGIWSLIENHNRP